MKVLMILLVFCFSFSTMGGAKINSKSKLIEKLGIVKFVDQKNELVSVYGNDKKTYKVKLKNVVSDMSDNENKSKLKAGNAVIFKVVSKPLVSSR